MSKILPANELQARDMRAAEYEKILLSMLAREPKPKFNSDAEQVEWISSRLQLADGILRVAMNRGEAAYSAVPLGSIVPIRVFGGTKKRGPKIEIEVPEEIYIRLQEEDPRDRDLLLLVEIDNDALRAPSEGSVIITP